MLTNEKLSFLETCIFEKIAFDPSTKPKEACTNNPKPFQDWKLPDQPLEMPPGYRLCLWKTSQVEPPIQDLLDPKNANPKGGVYVLQALPEQLSASALPLRRIFCRPRPFCRS